VLRERQLLGVVVAKRGQDEKQACSQPDELAGATMGGALPPASNPVANDAMSTVAARVKVRLQRSWRRSASWSRRAARWK
jgi:hypothetical protein